MYVLDGSKLLPNYGDKKDDKKIYLGLNQVPYGRDTELIGKGLCRTCISIQRKCPKADIEIGMVHEKNFMRTIRNKLRIK